MTTPMFIEIQNWDSTSKRFTLAEQVSHQPTLELTTGGKTQSVDMSCLVDTITDSISLDVQCDETVTPGAVVPFEWYSSANVLQGGDTGSSSTTETASSHTVTLRIQNDSYDEISLLARSRIGADGWNDYRLSGPGHIADIVAAGSTGVQLTEYDCSEFSGIACGQDVWMSCVDNGNYSYTFSFFTKEPDTVENTLVADLVSGENRVDMKPLLEHVGGKAETSATTFPLYGPDIFDDGDNYVHQNGYEIPPLAYALDWCTFYTGTIEDMYNGNGVRVQVISEVSQEDGTVIYTLSETPTFLSFQIYEVDAEGEYVDNIFYELGFDTSFTDILAAGLAGVTVAGYQYDPITHLSPPIDKTVNLVITAAPGEHSYRLAVSDGTVSAKLCLEPSCDPCIDLMPVVGDALTNVSGSFSCPTLVPYDHEQVAHAECKDANGNNILTGVTLTQTTGTNQYTVTFPSNAAKLLLMYNEVFGMDTSEPIYCRDSTGFIDLSSIHVGDRFCVVPRCDPLGD